MVPGQVLVLFAASLFVLFGSVGLAVDAGYLMAERRDTQNAADASAIAGAVALWYGDTGVIETSGVNYAISNGFAAGEVDMNWPPSADSAQAGNMGCVEAIINHEVTKFFVGAIIGGANWGVAARSTACTTPIDEPYAIIALDENGQGIDAGGTGSLTIENGGAMSNADTDICGGHSWISAEGPLDTTGEYTQCNNSTVVTNPLPRQRPAVGDPLLPMPEPDCSSLPVVPTRLRINSGDPNPYIVPPGNYRRGIQINDNNHVIVFLPGLYCFGGNLDINGGLGGNTIYGLDTVFYFYGNSQFDINGGGNNFVGSAQNPEVWDYYPEHSNVPSAIATFLSTNGLSLPACDFAACGEDVVIMYARGNPPNPFPAQPQNCNRLTLEGGNKTRVQGIIYTPCSLVRLGGHAGSFIQGQILAGSIDILGGSALTVRYYEYVQMIVDRVYLVE